MVPTRSNAPIIASTEAAGTAPRPASPHSEMKWLWIRPLVDRPQMKKLPNSTQNTRSRRTPASTRNGVAADTRARAGACTGAAGSAP